MAILTRQDFDKHIGNLSQEQRLLNQIENNHLDAKAWCSWTLKKLRRKYGAAELIDATPYSFPGNPGFVFVRKLSDQEFNLLPRRHDDVTLVMSVCTIHGDGKPMFSARDRARVRLLPPGFFVAVEKAWSRVQSGRSAQVKGKPGRRCKYPKSLAYAIELSKGDHKDYSIYQQCVKRFGNVENLPANWESFMRRVRVHRANRTK